jgi:DNA polymerase-3 subunit epsilon
MDALVTPARVAAPTATAEFLCVDTETNGRAGDDCELTEVGAVLVGGGELHERFESIVRTERPLSRGIERFTGITQAMVDSAPAANEVLPELADLLHGRVLVAHSASFDRRVLAQAFARAELDWPDPPVLCTIALARRFAPLARQRGLAPLAESLGIEVEGVHRALVDAETCARVFCALFPKLCAAAATLGEAIELCAPRRRTVRRKASERRARVPKEERPDLSKLPRDPGVYVFRDERGRPLYVGKSVSLRTRARAHFCAPAGWTERAEVVDYTPTCSELGALVLENRLIKRWRPPGNKQLKRADGYVYIRARLDIAYPVLEVAPEPASGRAFNVGPMRGRAAAEELVEQRQSLFGLRHCARRGAAPPAPVAVRAAPLRPRAAAPLASHRLRTDGSLPLAVPRRPRPEPLPAPARRGAGAVQRRGRRR